MDFGKLKKKAHEQSLKRMESEKEKEPHDSWTNNTVNNIELMQILFNIWHGFIFIKNNISSFVSLN